MSRKAAPDHPALAGHFPGNPLVPGVVLLDWAWQAAVAELPAGSQLLGVNHAKFLAPVRPDEEVEIALDRKPGSIAFVIRRGEQIAAQGSFHWSAP
jgi:3-hydroxymyristoyl/3-hydroxydecanoyl-(acyl carrier protein) dehydratase